MVLVFVNNIEIAPVYDFKVYRGNRNTAPFILNVDTSWKWAFNLTPRPINSRGDESCVLRESNPRSCIPYPSCYIGSTLPVNWLVGYRI
jgi:hypothetical protein